MVVDGHMLIEFCGLVNVIILDEERRQSISSFRIQSTVVSA